MSAADSTSKPLALPPASAPALADSTLVRSSFLVPTAALPGGEQGPSLPSAVAGTPTMSALWQALRRRWPVALGAALLAAFLAVTAIFILMPAKYTAQVRLHIASRGDARLFSEGGEEPEFVFYKANMAAMVKSQMVLVAALNQKTSTGQDVKDLNLVRENGVEWLETGIKTDFLIGPEILKVQLSADRGDEVAELLNGVAKAFVEENVQKDNQRRENRIRDLRENLGKMEVELNKLRQQLRGREKSLEIPDKDTRLAQYNAALVQQNKASENLAINRSLQIKHKEELETAQDRLKKIAGVVITSEKINEAFSKDFRTQGIFEELKKVEKEIIDTRTAGREPFITGTLRNLDFKKQDILKRLGEVKEQLRPEFEKAARSKIADDLNEAVVKAQDNLNTAQKQEPGLRTELQKAEETVRSLAPAAPLPLDVVNLQQKINNMEISMGQVAQTIQRLGAEVSNPRVSILQPASEPKNKDYSRQTKLAGAGGFGMFFLALFGVAFLEFRSRKISGADEVSHGLGLNLVGSLPAMPSPSRKGSAGTALQTTAWQTQLHEAIDGIRTMLLHASRTENLRVIMVTSASGGEGKTSLATQLAASLARSWRKTLLIDGDLRNPGAHKVFELTQEPGFSEVLRNEISLTDAIKPTSLGRLWVMPAGNYDSHAVQALAQDNMRTLFEQLKQQYDFIIVDSCPVLPVADSLLLGQHVDGVLFSVLRDISRAPAIYAAQQKLNNLGVRILGAVMIGAKNDVGTTGYPHSGS